jgi:hypothetical protein
MDSASSKQHTPLPVPVLCAVLPASVPGLTLRVVAPLPHPLQIRIALPKITLSLLSFCIIMRNYTYAKAKPAFVVI